MSGGDAAREFLINISQKIVVQPPEACECSEVPRLGRIQLEERRNIMNVRSIPAAQTARLRRTSRSAAVRSGELQAGSLRVAGERATAPGPRWIVHRDRGSVVRVPDGSRMRAGTTTVSPLNDGDPVKFQFCRV